MSLSYVSLSSLPRISSKMSASIKMSGITNPWPRKTSLEYVLGLALPLKYRLFLNSVIPEIWAFNVSK